MHSGSDAGVLLVRMQCCQLSPRFLMWKLRRFQNQDLIKHSKINFNSALINGINKYEKLWTLLARRIVRQGISLRAKLAKTCLLQILIIYTFILINPTICLFGNNLCFMSWNSSEVITQHEAKSRHKLRDWVL